MMTRDSSPLDADERAIAAQLARHAPAGAPVPALDAAVLTAARAASVGAAPASPQLKASRATWSRRRRWSAITGVAASLALAAGIAWQLRPVPGAAPVQDEASALPASAFRGSQDVQAAPERATASGVARATALPEEASPAAPLSSAATSDAPSPAAAAMQMEAVPQNTQETFAADSTAGSRPPAVASAPEASLPSQATSTPLQREAAAANASPPMSRAASATAVGRQVLRGAPVPPRTAVAASDAGNAIHTGDDHAGFSDEELDDSPPATVDSPEVHRAWLQRIRELRDTGRNDAARESLGELQRRFPHLPIPDDLAALAEHPQ